MIASWPLAEQRLQIRVCTSMFLTPEASEVITTEYMSNYL